MLLHFTPNTCFTFVATYVWLLLHFLLLSEDQQAAQWDNWRAVNLLRPQ